MARVNFIADYPGAIVYPADDSNYYAGPNTPRAIVLHTPEEPWDNYESTPVYFSHPNFNKDGSPRRASTHYYGDSDGDIIQMVPESRAAIANGLDGKPRPFWALPGISLNMQTINIELEGYARYIQDTFIVGGPQFTSAARWAKQRAIHHNIPRDRHHILGHYEVSVNRSDPGFGFPWKHFIDAVQDIEEEEELYIPANGVANEGYWEADGGKELHASSVQGIWLDSDFPVTKGATRVKLQVWMKEGDCIFLHGDSKLDAGRTHQGYGVVEVITGWGPKEADRPWTDQPGWAYIITEQATSKIGRIALLGYYTKEN